MAKRQFQLTNEQRQELMQTYENCTDGPLRTRLQAVRLYGSARPVPDIQEITGTPRRTLLRWCGCYQDEGIAGLFDKREGNHRQSFLTDEQVQALKEKLHQYRPLDILGSSQVATANGLHWTVPDLKQVVKQWYGVVYKQNKSYRDLFKQCGFSYQRTARIFRSRSQEKVADFEEELEKNSSTSPKRL
jgi:transposase